VSGGDGGDILFNGTKFCGDYLIKNSHFRVAKERSSYLSQKKIIRRFIKYNVIPFVPFIKDCFYTKYFWSDEISYPNPKFMNNKNYKLKTFLKDKNKLIKSSAFCNT
jgi:hypothetical protein